jgi:hypothetical protein
MGGRGSTSGLSQQVQAPAPIQFLTLTGSSEDEFFDDLEDSYDINTVLAIQQYIRQDVQSNGYTMSQNMNHKMENGMTLNANETYVRNRLQAAMHPLGKNMILTRAAHKDFLEALGVKNYQNMTDAQLNAAVSGAEYTEKKFVSAAVDASKNPFVSGPVSGGREVYIRIHAPSDTKGVMGNRSQSEVILSDGVKFRATGAHFDGTTARPRVGGLLPRVVVDVQVIE